MILTVTFLLRGIPIKTSKMIRNSLILSCFLIILSITKFSAAYFVLVDADAEECFFDKAENGQKLSKFTSGRRGTFEPM